MAIGTPATFTSNAKSKWGGNMKVGDIVMLSNTQFMGVLIQRLTKRDIHSDQLWLVSWNDNTVEPEYDWRLEVL